MMWLKYLVIGVVVAGLLAAGSVATPMRAASAGAAPEFLVKFHTPLSQAAVARLAARYGGRERVAIARIGVHVLTFAADANPQATLARLRSDSSVAYAEPNSLATASFVPDDPGYPNQWGLATVKAPQGWDIQLGSASAVIAIVDTGVDANHPDLSSKALPGWNYDPFSPGYNSADTTDNNGHGTHVAGIAAAVTNNALGVAGTCPNCAFMPVKVLSSDGSGTYDAVASGIVYAADHGARVISMSLGGSAFSQALQDAVDYAYAHGALLVAAAGNDGTNVTTYPAAFANVMAVAATTSTDQRASFSNYSSYIAVAAPGVDIYSTVWSSTSGSTYSYKSGTSMATPFVSGLAGLLVSQDPSRTNAALRTLIQNSADDINTPGWDQYTGYGRINVARALSGTISGSVTDAVNGATLINATVEALQGGQVKATTSTLSDGAYRLLYLPAGSYDIRVSQTGYTSQTRSGIAISAGQEASGVNFALTRVGGISGKVTSGRKAIAGALVQALQGAQVIGSATTDIYGNYQITNIPAGTYNVTASASGYQNQTKTGIVVNPGQTTSGVNFSLSR